MSMSYAMRRCCLAHVNYSPFLRPLRSCAIKAPCRTYIEVRHDRRVCRSLYEERQNMPRRLWRRPNLHVPPRRIPIHPDRHRCGTVVEIMRASTNPWGLRHRVAFRHPAGIVRKKACGTETSMCYVLGSSPLRLRRTFSVGSSSPPLTQPNSLAVTQIDFIH
jgi:hypothetical protein